MTLDTGYLAELETENARLREYVKLLEGWLLDAGRGESVIYRQVPAALAEVVKPRNAVRKTA